MDISIPESDNNTGASISAHVDKSVPQTPDGRIINHLANRASLTHTYFALRHGQSLANVSKIISSDPKISVDNHGLSDVGKTQAKAAGDAFATDYFTSHTKNINNYKGVAIFSSDFARARETASIFANSLTTSGIPLFLGAVAHDARLRERYFGDLNGGPDTHYQEVWDMDVVNADHTNFSVESANSVLERTTKFIIELDDGILSENGNAGSGGERWICVLVAHGDVLQIAQTGFLHHMDASKHRSLSHLGTATIRKLTFRNN